MFSEDYRSTIGFIGLAFILIPLSISKFKDIKSYGCTIPLIGVLLICIPIFFLKNIIIVKNNKIIENKNTFFSSFNFKYHNGKVEEIIIDDEVLINDSDDNLTVETVIYGNENGENANIDISPKSYSEIKGVDYYFEEPPQTIRQKSTDSKVKYWLHY